MTGVQTCALPILHTSDEEKAEARAKLERLAAEYEGRILAHAETIAALQRDVVAAELSQDDTYTKRARPTLVYAGLAVLFLNHVLLPWLAYFRGMSVPTIDLPAEFWWGWTGVVGAWAVGRTVEKRAKTQGREPGKVPAPVAPAS